MASPTILVFERDPEVLRVLRKILERAGFGVLTARSGQQALGIYSRHGARIDLLLVDGQPPELRSLLAQPGIKVVGLNDDDDFDSTLPVLQKPFTPEALLSAIRLTLQ